MLINERLKRNKTDLRLREKPTKRDLKWSEDNLISSFKEKRLNSREGEIKEENYIRINNTNLSPKEVVNVIKSEFELQ